MTNLTDIKPWFQDDLVRLVSGIYFSARQIRRFNGERWIGYLMMASSLLLAIGANPESVFAPDDIQILHTEMR